MVTPKKPQSDAYINYVEKYEKYLTSFKTFKTSLKKIVKHNISMLKINEAVNNINKIIIHTYQFLKLYCLYEYYENNELLTQINYKKTFH
jgi:hypothetical protein